MKAKKNFSIKSNSITTPVFTLEVDGSKLKVSDGEYCSSIFDISNIRYVEMFKSVAHSGFACFKVDGIEIGGAYLLDDMKAFISNIE